MWDEKQSGSYLEALGSYQYKNGIALSTVSVAVLAAPWGNPPSR